MCGARVFGLGVVFLRFDVCTIKPENEIYDGALKNTLAFT